MKKLVLLGALALSVLSLQAFADQKPLKIGIEAAYPPFASKAPDGSIVGFDYDIGNALCEEMKVKCVWVEQEFDGLIPALKVRKIDAILSSMSITEDRQEVCRLHQQVLPHSGASGDEGRHCWSATAWTSSRARKSACSAVRSTTVSPRKSSRPKAPTIVPYSSQNEIYLDVAAGRLDGTVADATLLQ